jgi:hypothetical protein
MRKKLYSEGLNVKDHLKYTARARGRIIFKRILRLECLHWIKWIRIEHICELL